MRRLALSAILLLSAACAGAPQTYRELDRIGRDYQREVATQPQSPDEATARDTCGASRFRHLVGAGADQIDRAALPAQTRVITPDMMVTADFSAERLNIMIGTDGKVGSLRCF